MNQLTLGEFIKKLERFNQGHDIEYDFAEQVPTKLRSWRGDYFQLALGYQSDEIDTQSVGDLLKHCKSMLGTTVEGYKGGDYTVTEGKHLWVANYSRSGHTAIVDLISTGCSVVIKTEYMEW